MSHPSKAKGDAAELEAARLLAERTGWPVKRKLGAGRAEDCGDLAGIPDTCVQVKNYPADIVRAIRETLTELPAQQANAGATFAVGLIRRPRRRGQTPGGEWFAVLDLDNLCALLREATFPDWDPPMDPPGSLREAMRARGAIRDEHPTRRAQLRRRAGIE